jgi:hypothetical protein
VLEEALTRLGAARCAATLGDTERASVQARAAEEVFRRLGAAALSAEAAAIVGT